RTHYAGDAAAVAGGFGIAQADILEHFLHLALGGGVRVGQFLAQRLGAPARAGQAIVPAQAAVDALAPVVVPAFVGGDVAVLKVGGGDVVLGLHLIGGVDRAAQGAIRLVCRVERELVVGERLGHGVHARVT